MSSLKAKNGSSEGSNNKATVGVHRQYLLHVVVALMLPVVGTSTFLLGVGVGAVILRAQIKTSQSISNTSNSDTQNGGKISFSPPPS